MLSITVTILFAISTVALVILVYNTVATGKRKHESTTETTDH